jgi:acyl-coenzyme A thioesterase PaaI-like protein
VVDADASRSDASPGDAASGDAARRDAALGERLLRHWLRLRTLPGGRRVFSMMLGRIVPYSGSIRAEVLALQPGRAVLRMRDRRALRNHLRSVHAIAIANLGELASGLAAIAALPPGVRGIPRTISIEYHRKARGTLTAEGTAVIPPVADVAEAVVEAHISNAAGEPVATVRVLWQLERV